MNKLIIFGLGAAVGSLLTWRILDKKYRDLAEEEIESVVDYYKMKEELDNNVGKKVDLKEDKVTKRPEIKKPEVIADPKRMTEEEYDKITNDLGYNFTREDNVIVTKEEDGSIWMEQGKESVEPYVISPEEFGEDDIYDTKSWTLYTDGVITDDIGQIVDDPENIIGDALEHFGEFEDDAVHVRNEDLECDYEIIKYPKSFSDLNRGIMDDASPRS